MKRIIKVALSLALALAICVGFLILSGFAANKPAKLPVLKANDAQVISITSAATQHGSGQEVLVTVNISKNPGLSSLKLIVSYDATALEAVSAAIDDAVSEGMQANTNIDNKNGTVTLNWVNVLGESYFTGTFATIGFQAKDGSAVGDYSLVLSYDQEDVYNNDYQDVVYELSNGAVSIAHSPVEHAAVPATCTEKGTQKYWSCSGCELLFSDEGGNSVIEAPAAIPALGHEIVADAAVEPTCTETGLTAGEHCSRCNYKVAQETVPALGHDYVDHEAKTPTCTEAGWNAYQTCTRCDYTTRVDIAALGHDLVTDAAVAATCTETGLTEGCHCSRCDYKIAQEVVPALGHDLIADPAVAATCTETGLTAGEHCSRCDYKVAQEVVPALGHDLADHEAKAATCTEVGWEAYQTCTRCDYTTYAEIPALGHDLVVDEAVAATCTETGLTEGKHCTRCDYKEAQEEVPALGHDLITDPAVAATCTETGLTAGEHCSRCDYKVAQEVVPALGHDLVDHKAKAATCTEVGCEAYQTCSRCDYTTYAEIPALGHDLVDHEAKAATCTETGWEAYQTCSRCDYTTFAETPALGHDLVVDAGVAATCTEPGLSDGAHCSRCDYKEAQEEVPALGHDWDDGVVTTPATATTDGVKTFTCKRCGETKTESIPASGDLVNPFVDVKENDYFYDAVLWAYYHDPQVTNGLDSTHFGPYATCTRGQIVTFLWRALGEPAPTITSNPFVDVKESDYYYKAVLWAYEKGVTTGTDATHFAPNAFCKREHAVAFLYRAAGSPECTNKDNPFTDVSSSAYYYDAVLWAVEKNITKGIDATQFGPANSCQRCQIVTFLYRFMNP